MRKISAKKLKALGGKMPFSTIASPRKAVRKSNPIAKAKRKALYRKMLASPEYKKARALAMERAGDRCEEVQTVTLTWTTPTLGEMGSHTYAQRCLETLNLHAHHLRYPKSRPVNSDDLKILCKWHHEQSEFQKPHKTRMFRLP